MSFITLASRLVPRTDNRHSGIPNKGKTSSATSLAILIAFWPGAGNTNGHLVRKSWRTMM